MERIGIDDRMVYQQADRKRQQEQEMAPEEIAQMLQERYGSRYADSFTESSQAHVQRKLVDRNPMPGDPTMFMIKCANGHEAEIVQEVTKRVLANQYSIQAYQIHSIFYKENIKGHIYVEAKRKQDVLDALQGVSYVFLGKGGARVVILAENEYSGLLVIKKPELKMKAGDWVRFNKSKYAGDLAQVIEVMPESEKVVVKVVPRVEAPSAPGASGAAGGRGKRKKSQVRPPPKLFNPKDPQYGQKVSQPQNRPGMYYYNAEYFDRQGYAVRTTSIRALDINIPAPTFDERQAFLGGAGIDAKSLSESDRNLQKVSVDDFVVGEGVRVVAGPMKGATGEVEGLERELIRVKLSIPGGKALTATMKPDEVAKNFKTGEHVRVVSGQYTGETGMVVEVSGNTALVISDSTRRSIEVFTNYLRLATEGTLQTATSAMYAVRDLLELSGGDVGCVVQVQNDVLTILDQSGNIRKISGREVVRKRVTERAVTTDSRGQPIVSGDMVTLTTQPGDPQSKKALVLHVYRSVLFLLSKDITENGGVFISRSKDVVISSKKDQKGGRGGASAMGAPPARPAGNADGSRYGQQFAVPGAPPVRSGPGGRHPWLHKSVAITGGPQKGYVGMVKAVTGDEARVEIHATSKVVRVHLDKLAETDADGKIIRRGGTPVAGGYMGGGYNPAQGRFGGATPGHAMGAQTPTWGAGGGRTPGYAAGGRTPGYDMGNRTPGYDFGNRTPAADYGSRTPAWDSGSKTPAWDAGSKTPAWDAGSKTPAWEAGSKTPAWDPDARDYGGSAYANTPFGNAPTPGDTTHSVSWQEGALKGMSLTASTFALPRLGRRTACHKRRERCHRHPEAATTVTMRQRPVQRTMLPHLAGDTRAADTPTRHQCLGATAQRIQTHRLLMVQPHRTTCRRLRVQGTLLVEVQVCSTIDAEPKRALTVFTSTGGVDDWVVTEIQVRIKEGAHAGKEGVIRTIGENRACNVALLPGLDETIQIGSGGLEPVRPEKKDRIKLLSTSKDSPGGVGSLVGIDGSDAIVRLDKDAASGFKIVALSAVGKLVQA